MPVCCSKVLELWLGTHWSVSAWKRQVVILSIAVGRLVLLLLTPVFEFLKVSLPFLTCCFIELFVWPDFPFVLTVTLSTA